MRRKLGVILLLCFTVGLLSAQVLVSGKVQDEAGQELPYCTIYKKGTTQGTSTNLQGDYSLELSPGEHVLVYEYLGYTPEEKVLNIGQEDVIINVVLRPETFVLEEVSIRSDAEDPAYRMIRKAMEKRQNHLDALTPSASEVYIKGRIDLEDAPEKLLGEDIGDLGGMLDSSRQGILYLSETQSQFLKESSTDVKEIIESSIVSGSDQGASFNRAISTDFNIYEKTIEIERDIPSPIAPNAMAFYEYKLLGSSAESGYLLYKIQVIPKKAELAAWEGIIYLVQGEWAVHSVDLKASGKSLNSSFMDSLILQQNYIYVQEMDAWQVKSQVLRIFFSAFGFRPVGAFVNVYNNYKRIEPGAIDNLRERVRFQEDAVKLDSAFWENRRPIPLTPSERRDYVKKDSLNRVWESKEYLDSIDAEGNRFKPLDLLTGYTYNNSYKKRSFGIDSPLGTYQFNTVQGHNIQLKSTLSRWTDTTQFIVRPHIEYGFSNERLYGGIEIYRFVNDLDARFWRFGVGRDLFQYNRNKPFPDILNTYTTLINHINYWRVYEADYAQLEYQKNLSHSLIANMAIRGERRRVVENTTNFSFFNRDLVYASNRPDNTKYSEENDLVFDSYAGLELELTYIPFRPYQKLPKTIWYGASKWPIFRVYMRNGFDFGQSYSSFYHLQLSVQADWDLLTFGESRIYANVGDVLQDENIHFADFKHFMGNETTLQVDHGMERFLALPFYQFSTDDFYAELHYSHTFQGNLLDRIPLIRKLKFETVVGTNLLYTADHPFYSEYTVGLDNVGFGLFRILRLDLVSPWIADEHQGLQFRIAFSQTL